MQPTPQLTKIRSTLAVLACLCGILAASAPAPARTIVVAATHPAAADTNPATEDKPLKTIGAGAELAQPGDTVLVHGGTYREWVKFPRGGESEEKRITYRAAPGEKVFVKGSDQITNWRRDRTGLWMAEFEKGYFGDYNPYELIIRGEWLDYGEGCHRGDVYLDGVAYIEKRSQYECQMTPGTWYSVVENGKTTLWANFGDADPNQHLAEINVRHAVFFPEVRGLKYITIDGFTVAHSSENWGPPGTRIDGQWGAIGTRWGFSWIIENCTVINAKCIGICLGVNPFPRPPGATRPSTTSTRPAPATTTSRPAGGRGEPRDLESFGHHIVRNNHVLRCGQAGIAGDSGAAASLIEHNLVEFTNDRGLFGGSETAGIKFHFAIDAVLKNNTIHGVGSGAGYAGYGIWLDFGNQNTRVTGNLIYDTESSCLFIEASHGPILVDNNIFIGKDINSVSESQIFVHNLFYHCTPGWSEDSRRPPVWAPHTARQVRGQTITPRDDKWLNNIFIGGGMDQAPDPATPAPTTGPTSAPARDPAYAKGFVIDYNVYLDGARKSRLDEHSIVEPGPVDWNFYNDGKLVAVDLRVSKAVAELACPRITSEMLGKFAVSGMMAENHDGSPIEISTDFFGAPRKGTCVGPFAGLKAGMSSFTVWSTVTGESRPYRIRVLPASVVVKPGSKQQFSEFVWDQYGNGIVGKTGCSWATSGGGSADGAGQFTAGQLEGGPWKVSAELKGLSAEPGAASTQHSALSTQHSPVGVANVWVSKEPPGLSYAYYEGTWAAIPDFASLTPAKTGTAANFDVSLAPRPEFFGLRFDGRISIAAAGKYTFYVHADDGAKLFIDGAPVVDNDGGHAIREARGSIDLKPGLHPIAVTYFQAHYARQLIVEYEGPGVPRQPVPDAVLFGPKGREK